LREGPVFTYDIEVTASNGDLRERWEGLRLRVVGDAPTQDAWATPLLGPYAERRVRELIPGSAVAVAVERDPGAERRSQSDRAIQRALREKVTVRRRPDGRPEVGEANVSAAHCGDLTVAVAGSAPLGCDVEAVKVRPDPVWRDLLGPKRLSLAELVANEACEEKAIAATRVWAASECLRKAGTPVDAPLVLASSAAEGWVLLSSGPLVTATFVAPVRGAQNKIVLAFLSRANTQPNEGSVVGRR
jgi:enediyne polyketide synthase